MPTIILVSHVLCPYVQRAVIVATEKRVPYTRIDIDLENKPAWFLAISPTGKTPLLRVDEGAGEHILFESAPIAEYLDEIAPEPLLPDAPLERARHRAWVEFASGTLADIAGLYGAPDETGFAAKSEMLQRRFIRLEDAVAGPWFGGKRFGLVDAAFGPVFRYLDAFEMMIGLRLASDLPKITAWRLALAERPSVRSAVSPEYPELLETFLLTRGSYLADRAALAGR